MEDDFIMVNKTSFPFRTIRIVLEDDILKEELKLKRYSYITGVSYGGWYDGKEIVIKSKKTPVIQLNGRSEDDVFSGFNDTTRNEIRKTEKSSQYIFKLPDINTRAILGLYKKFEIAGNRQPRASVYFRDSLFAGAYCDGVLVAAIICYNSFPYLRVHAIVSAGVEIISDRRIVSYTTRRLVWEFCQYGLKKNYAWLDLGGVNQKDPQKAGITAFKMSFGGELINEYTYTYKSLLYSYVRALFYKRR